MTKINIFKNTSILLYAQVITVLTSLIYFSVLARVFSKEDFGAFSQIFIIITIAIVVFSFSIPLSIQYFIAQTNNRNNKENILNQIINICLVLCFIGSIVIYFLFPYIAKSVFNNEGIIILKFYVIFLVISQIISSTFDFTFVTLNKLKLVFYRKTYFSLLKLLITFITYINELSLYEFLLLLTILECCFAVYTVIAIKKEIKDFSFTFDSEIVKKVFYYSYPLAIAAVIAILNVEFSKLFVSINYDIDVFAEYSIVSRELPLYIVGTSLTAVLIPVISNKVSENKIKEALKIWHSSIELSLIATVWMIGLIIVMAKEVVTFLYSAKYLEGYMVFIVFTILLLTKITYFGLLLRSTGNTKILLYSSFFNLFTTILLTFTMSSLFGIIGVALAVLTSAFLSGFLQLILSAKIVKVKFLDVFPWKPIVNVLFTNLVIGSVIFIIKVYTDKYVEHNFFSIVIFASIWLTIVIVLYFKKIKNLKTMLS